MFGKSFPLFKVLGFQLKVDVTWLFLAFLIAWSLAQGFFPAVYPDQPASTYWWMAVLGVVGFVFSLVFHELSHSLVARRYGLPIGGITLFIFGGVAEMQEEPPSPKAEFQIAIAGPIASAVLAVAFYGISVLGNAQGWPVAITGITYYLALLNIVLAVFNVLPAFPLDGGRVLRAFLWHRRDNLMSATQTASKLGGWLGYGLIGLGILNIFATGNIIGGVWWALIGLFIRWAATSSFRQLIMQQTFTDTPVSRFMTENPTTVNADTKVETLIEDYFYRHHHSVFPVMDGNELKGLVSVRGIKELSEDSRKGLKVGEVYTPASGENTVDENADAMSVLKQMQSSGQFRLLVTSKGKLKGIVALSDLLRILEIKSELQPQS